MPDYDVVVVGGGPSGSVSALRCAKLGLKVLLLERGDERRHKPCGGVFPAVCEQLFSEAIGRSIPSEVFSSPRRIELILVPPSGRRNGGRIVGYELLNLERDLLDHWLLEEAERAGADVRVGTNFTGLTKSDCLKIDAVSEEREQRFTSRYLVGADGVFSKIRNSQCGRRMWPFVSVIQERWVIKGDLEECFYSFYGGKTSPFYSYLIPKASTYELGTGANQPVSNLLSASLRKFKDQLRGEYHVELKILERQEVWAIPFGSLCHGSDDCILVGDAGGFCNPMSGEGIRFGIESAISASSAVEESMSSGRELAEVYRRHIQPIADLVNDIKGFVESMDDSKREEYVQSQLSRGLGRI